MDYKYEFERLLGVAKQVSENTDFDKRKVHSFAALRALRNAVNFYHPFDTKPCEFCKMSKIFLKAAKFCPNCARSLSD